LVSLPTAHGELPGFPSSTLAWTLTSSGRNRRRDRCLETTDRFHKRPHPFLPYTITAKISGAVAGSAGAVSCFIDSALK
jgi:hypothetical protein